ncbi:hypothetical protein JCM19239_4832 [Vibrio variabilis]|uniref:Uncharacterized protein n=1 Tax=Vibrio variabilis TaxID=990271 RepID=A0ABQ0JGH4_9VIBR|nr:hypothetical protein JCM19239_4832 [Vibrio variabilis]
MEQSNKTLSLASRRAIELGYDDKGPEWMIEFDVMELKGDFAYEEGVIRRDPTAVIEVDGLLHCWYTKGEGETQGFTGKIEDKVFPWDLTEVWHATSEDGIAWIEQVQQFKPANLVVTTIAPYSPQRCLPMKVATTSSIKR